MSQIKEAKKKFKDYYECPEGCGAIYHSIALTHRNYECKDCRQVFLVPAEVKISAPKPFRKPEQRK